MNRFFLKVPNWTQNSIFSGQRTRPIVLVFVGICPWVRTCFKKSGCPPFDSLEYICVFFWWRRPCALCPLACVCVFLCPCSTFTRNLPSQTHGWVPPTPTANPSALSCPLNPPPLRLTCTHPSQRHNSSCVHGLVSASDYKVLPAQSKDTAGD